MADDPQFTEDMLCIEDSIRLNATDAVLDLGAVHFLNSSNLAHLLKLRKQLHERERQLMLCSISGQVWGAFLATGLDRVFDFSASVPNALATLQMK